MLKFLHLSSVDVVPRDAVLQEIWGYNAGVTTHSRETSLYCLRQKTKLGRGNASQLIEESGGYGSLL